MHHFDTHLDTNLFWPRTATLDWCEENYVIDGNIAEFFNTVSNLPFVVLPPLLMYLFRDYSHYVTEDINYIWLMLLIVGVGSGYFHATLSFAGQMLDELAIFYVILAALSVSLPDRYLQNNFFQGSRLRLKIFLACFGVIGTILAFIQPQLNAFLLQTFAVPFIYLVVQKVRVSGIRNFTVLRLIMATIFWWFCAITAWINDRIFCDVWKNILDVRPNSISLVQFHSLWHVLIVIASYCGIVMIAYYRALELAPGMLPRIVYFPYLGRGIEIGIPYVKLDIVASEKKIE